jgi:hypothetical protein
MTTITLTSLLSLDVVCAFLLGVPLNAVLLFWAIRRHTPAGLRPYARLLQQTCVTDLVLLTVNLNLLLNPVSRFFADILSNSYIVTQLTEIFKILTSNNIFYNTNSIMGRIAQ